MLIHNCSNCHAKIIIDPRQHEFTKNSIIAFHCNTCGNDDSFRISSEGHKLIEGPTEEYTFKGNTTEIVETKVWSISISKNRNTV